MKKFIISASSLLVFYQSVYAESFQPTARLGLDVRVDFTANSNTAAAEDTIKTEEFAAPNPRINLLGELGSKTSYRIRLDASGTYSGGGNDHLSDAFNYLYLYHEFNDSLGIRVGKQFVVTSAWEFNYDTSKIYHYGETFLKVPSFYETGASVELKFSGQTVGLQAANSQPETGTNAKQRADDLIQGIYWYGSLIGDLLQPIASAVWFPRVRAQYNGVRDQKATITQYALGTRVNLKALRFDLTLGQVSMPEYQFFDIQNDRQTTRVSEDWQGIVFNAQYNLTPQWQPFAKITYDQSKVDSKKSASFLRYSLGTEYYPENDKWWLHTTYIHQDNKESAFATPKASRAERHQKTDTLLAGVGVYYY